MAVLVIAEHHHGALPDATHKVVTAASKFGGDVDVLVAGENAGAVSHAHKAGTPAMGGIIILLMGPVDALDGTMARLKGEPSEFGAFVDSVTDRYSELVIFGALLIYYVTVGDVLYAVLAYLAAAGAVLVSYTRARAQSLGYETKVGVLTRFERYLVLAPCLVFNIPGVALWILAVLGNLTALQRIWDVRSKVHKIWDQDNSPKET